MLGVWHPLDGAMSVRDLPTLEQGRALRPLKQKWDMPTLADARADRDADDKKKLAIWRDLVFALDKFTCRCCGCRVTRTLRRQPDRAEAHHVVGRADKAVRYDVRNGITLCHACHRRVTGMVKDKLVIIGSAFFHVTDSAVRYLNARQHVDFQEAA